MIDAFIALIHNSRTRPWRGHAEHWCYKPGWLRFNITCPPHKLQYATMSIKVKSKFTNIHIDLVHNMVSPDTSACVILAHIETRPQTDPTFSSKRSQYYKIKVQEQIPHWPGGELSDIAGPSPVFRGSTRCFLFKNKLLTFFTSCLLAVAQKKKKVYFVRNRKSLQLKDLIQLISYYFYYFIIYSRYKKVW